MAHSIEREVQIYGSRGEDFTIRNAELLPLQRRLWNLADLAKRPPQLNN